MSLFVRGWDEEETIILANSLDNLRLLKILHDSGYKIPQNASYVERDVSAEEAINLLFDAANLVLGTMEFTPVLDENGEEDDSHDFYYYQPGAIEHQKLRELYDLATEPGDDERIADAIESFMYSNNDIHRSYETTSLVLTVNSEKNGYIMEFYQFDWSFCSVFVEMMIQLDHEVERLLAEFEMRERQKALWRLKTALQVRGSRITQGSE